MTDKPSGEKLLYCSFCGKSQHEVRKLIAGPSVYICDECVELCMGIVNDDVPVWKVLELMCYSACNFDPLSRGIGVQK